MTGDVVRFYCVVVMDLTNSLNSTCIVSFQFQVMAVGMLELKGV